jgi:hypothetical protein
MFQTIVMQLTKENILMQEYHFQIKQILDQLNIK